MHAKCDSVVSHSGILWTVALQAPLSMGFSRMNTGVSCHFLLHTYIFFNMKICIWVVSIALIAQKYTHQMLCIISQANSELFMNLELDAISFRLIIAVFLRIIRKVYYYNNLYFIADSLLIFVFDHKFEFFQANSTKKESKKHRKNHELIAATF